ncbi:hypothetical protein, partial [Massilia genomosp. 1]|uniref:hypothetical protein n=1 Tax=Massilia genomosp. 1 TaxID=2609280 RepID=UPI001C9E7E42
TDKRSLERNSAGQRPEHSRKSAKNSRFADGNVSVNFGARIQDKDIALTRQYDRFDTLCTLKRLPMLSFCLAWNLNKE